MAENKKSIVIDSNITLKQALAHDPNKPEPPPEILDQLELLRVEYISFDGKLHRGQIVVHRELAGDVQAMFKLAVETKFPISKVVPNAHPEYNHDTKKLVIDHNVSYGFGYRKIKDTDKLSLHGYGRAIDINPIQNPYIRYRDDEAIVFPLGSKWNPKASGTLTKDTEITKLMEQKGWQWGGHWTKQAGVTDYMHLQRPSSK